MNHLDGFSGYGGFSLAFEQANWKFDKTYFSEIDKYAIANYKHNFPNAIYAGSITDIPTSGIIEKLDLFTFGWPCQDNSIAGKRKGQTAGTRSGLLYSAVKIINKYKPRIFVAENVEGLRSVNKGIDIIESLKVLSYLSESNPQYDVEMQLLNTRWFLPQNRERLFFIGHLRDGSSRQIFPIGKGDFGVNEGATNSPVVRCFTAGGHSGGMHSGMTLVAMRGRPESSVLSPKRTEYGKQVRKKYESGELVEKRKNIQQLEPRTDGCTNTITSVQKDNLVITANTKKGYEIVTENDSINLAFPESKTRRGRIGKGVAQTLDKGCNQGVLEDKSIRRLTPIETERLQGLPDNWTKYGVFEKKVWIDEKLKTFKIVEGVEEISDSQRYKLVGNGVSIPPVKMIAEKLKKIYDI